MVTKDEVKDSVVFWIAVLVNAERLGSEFKFAEAYQNLIRLGIVVRFTKDFANAR